MKQAHARAPAPLLPQIVRRGHAIRRRVRARSIPVAPVLAEAEEMPPAWIADLRFFLTCYAAGLILFFVMLS
jgi:hypothetical protein